MTGYVKWRFGAMGISEDSEGTAGQISGSASLGRRKPFGDLKPAFDRLTFTRSMFGNQRRYGEGAPGPGTYKVPSSFGNQVLSSQKSPEKAYFGRSTRDQQYKIHLSSKFDRCKYGIGSPGPTVCDDRSSLGNQVASVKKTMPCPRFGIERRFKYGIVSSSISMPGVGQYKSVGAVGKQPESGKPTCPAYSFTYSDRDHKVFISPNHEKAHYGEESPGPAVNVKAPSSLGLQMDSRKHSFSGVKFGSAARFKGSGTNGPGPGEYNC